MYCARETEVNRDSEFLAPPPAAAHARSPVAPEQGALSRHLTENSVRRTEVATLPLRCFDTRVTSTSYDMGEQIMFAREKSPQFSARVLWKYTP